MSETTRLEAARYTTTYPTSRRTYGGDIAVKIFDYLELMVSVARERRQLRQLDSRALKDLGLNHAAAEAEAARPFWDLPNRTKIKIRK